MGKTERERDRETDIRQTDRRNKGRREKHRGAAKVKQSDRQALTELET